MSAYCLDFSANLIVLGSWPSELLSGIRTVLAIGRARMLLSLGVSILYPELHKLARSVRLVTCKLIPEHLMPFWRQLCAQSDFDRYFGKSSALFFF